MGRRESHRNPAICPSRPTPLRRRIHLADGIWRYAIGRGGITIQRPDGEKVKIDMSTFTGWSWYDLEKAAYKGGGPCIAPSDVSDYIERHLKPGGATRPARPSKRAREIVEQIRHARDGKTE